MIEAFFPVDPGDLAVNRMFKCACQAGRGKLYAAAKSKSAKRLVRVTALKEWGDAPVYPDGPVVLEYTVRPAQQHRQGPAKGQGRLDVDAASKALLDALNGAAYTDDSQVSCVVGRKTLEGPVGIHVRVYRPEEKPRTGPKETHARRLLDLVLELGAVEYGSVQEMAEETQTPVRSLQYALKQLKDDYRVSVTWDETKVRLEAM